MPPQKRPDTVWWVQAGDLKATERRPWYGKPLTRLFRRRSDAIDWNPDRPDREVWEGTVTWKRIV